MNRCFMSSVNSNQPPPLISMLKSNVSDQPGKIVLTSSMEGATNGKIELVAKKLQPPKEGLTVGAQSLKKEVVQLNLKQSDNSVAAFEVKIKDLAKVLGVSDKKIKELSKEEGTVLEEFISG